MAKLKRKASGSKKQKPNKKACTPAVDISETSERAVDISETSERADTPSSDESESTLPIDWRATVEEVDDEDDEDVPALGEPDIEPKEELKKLQQEWVAPCYAFFSESVSIEYVDGRLCHVFTCLNRRCRSKTFRRFQDKSDASSTSNMRCHVVSCWGKEALAAADKARTVTAARLHVKTWAQTGKITDVFERLGGGKETYSTKPLTALETRVEMVRWVCESLRPFSIIEDPGFRWLCKTGRSNFALTSAKTLARDVLKVFDYGHARVIQLLRTNPSKIHIQTDAWTAPNHRAYVAIVANCEYEGKCVRFLLDLREVAEGHSGAVLARELEASLKEHCIEEKLLTVIADNASANDTMIDDLTESLDTFGGRANQVRCFAHVLNLVAKTIISQFDSKRATSKDPDGNAAASSAAAALADIVAGLDVEIPEEPVGEGTEEEGDVSNVDDDIDGWIDERDDLSELEKDELRANVLPIKLVLAKLRKLAQSITNSSTRLLPAWKKLFAALKLAVRIMPRDVATRWNSTFVMLDFALQYRVAVDKMTGDRELELRQLELEDDEWRLVEELRGMLEIFHKASLFFSCGDGSPLVSGVIPAIDHIDEALTTSSLNANYSPAIRSACALAKKTLNRYYSKTDESDMYRICMMLHPSYKWSYFKQVKWLPEWINAADEVIHRAWYDGYAHVVVEADTLDIEEVPAAAGVTNIFDQLTQFIPNDTPSILKDELNTFLDSPCENVEGDPLGWWNRNHTRYPRLSRIARDYLSAPATTVDVERVFSQGRIILSHTCNRLSPRSMRALMCVGAWSRLGLFKTHKIASILKANNDGASAFDADDVEDEIDGVWSDILRHMAQEAVVNKPAM